MQAYCVSKRPPRALFLALAIALGVVAVSAAVLPMVGGGLMRGAPDLMHFIAPQDNESGCTWRNEYTATDANHDGHPEYVHGRMLGTCVVDADHNGVPEAGLTIARDFQVWDNDSDGTFNALEGRQGG